MHSTRAWLSVAVGAEPPARDRPAEFRVVASTDELLALLDEMGGECVALLDGATFDPDRTGLAPWRQGPEADEPVPAAWALIHALVHLREHVAHAQLTRQPIGTSWASPPRRGGGPARPSAPGSSGATRSSSRAARDWPRSPPPSC